MKTLDEWFELYGVSHKNPTNVKIHKICVPLIMMSLLGLLWSIPVPFELPFYLNFSTLFIFLCLIFYALLDLKVMVFMLIQSALMLVAVYFTSMTGKLFIVNVTVFVLAWIGQFIGHKIEGAKPSFFEDLQFLLIGPVWVFPFFKK